MCFFTGLIEGFEGLKGVMKCIADLRKVQSGGLWSGSCGGAGLERLYRGFMGRGVCRYGLIRRCLP